MSPPAAIEDSPAASIAPAALPAEPLPRGAIWVVLGRMANVAATALVAFVVPRCLPEAECGRFWLAQSWLGLLCLLAAAGLPLAIVKLLGEALAARHRQPLRAALRSSLGVLMASSMVVTTAVAGWLLASGGGWLGLNSAGLVALVVALGLLSWQLVLVEATRGLGELRWASLFAGGQFGGPIAALLFAIGLMIAAMLRASTAATALEIHAASLVATLPLVALGLTFAWRKTIAPLSLGSLPATELIGTRTVLALSLPILATQLLAFVTLSADLLLAGYYLPKPDIALLGQSRRLLLLLQVPSQMALGAILPAVARLYAERKHDRLERLLRRTATLTALAALPVAAILLAAGGSVLGLLFGDFYRQGAPLLAALAIGQVIAVNSGLAGYVLLMAGQQRAVVIVNGCTAVLMLFAGSLAAAFGGLLPLAIVAASILALQSLLEWWLAHRLLGIWTHADWRLLFSGRLLSRGEREP